MPHPRLRLFPATLLGGLMLCVAIACAPAQEPIPLRTPGEQPNAQPDPTALPEGTEVLAKGPVHEAFAATAETPVASPVVTKQPPEPIEELPPDQKPEGDNVQWIPGYWGWDEDTEQFLWVSGFWRDPPPRRLWVPGSWRQVQGGWQWVAGFWQEPNREQPTQPEIEYLPEPPVSLEAGPSVAAPTATSFYVPGSWVWRNKYVWRPGVWIEYRPNWVWVPAHFCRTPVGFVFVDGYWDYTLAQRGVLYAPVTFSRTILTRRGFVYTPVYVVSEPALVGALFVRRGRTHYYFGDYFEPRYVARGYNPWAGRVVNATFTIGFGAGRNWGYDPLWAHYATANRNNRAWNARVNDLYTGRYAGKVARPPVTLTQQNTVINQITQTNVTNVTNNVTVVNNNVTINKQNVTDVAMVAPARLAKDLQPEVRIRPITAEVRKTEAQAAKLTRDVAVQRTKVETAAATSQPLPKIADPKAPPTVQPRTLKLDVPKEVVARTQMRDEKKAPPPPAFKAEPKVNPKLDPTPKVNPKVEPKTEPNPKAEPKTNPKTEPKMEPKVEPKTEPKMEPKPKTDPKIEPKPKTDPKVEPKPKLDPSPKVEPKPKEPLPDPKSKVEPKKGEPVPKPKEPVPLPTPKTEPPKVEPKAPLPPKVDPKPKDPTPQPKPKGEMPKVEPKVPVPQPPKVDPKPKDPAPVPAPQPKAPGSPPPKAEPKGPPAPQPKGEPKKD
ncbi:hypothetical protein R5W23_000424 [Gemmata sp. JC673]|uniref:Uncharacterized protein n=1 Tax=Gemmata algarum TaxID=2975278 RepID=A0ABU5EVU9_9BACT|nr:hypothetical protein [Gemmata algarum]MDY3559431.1 hypothetical protein [Gemmata algarum]